MSAIDLYQVLRKIPEVSDEQAKQAAASVAEHNQVATKADIAELRASMRIGLGLLIAIIATQLAPYFS